VEGFSKIIKNGGGNTLIITALIGAMIANALPTPADSLYFNLQSEIKEKLEKGEITPKEYWTKDIVNYYTYTAAWYALLIIIMLAIDGKYQTNAKILIALIGGGFVFSVWRKNIEKDEALLKLHKQYKSKLNGTQ